MDISQIHSLFLKCNAVSIDTRKIESNSLFVAIKGENFDANTFANEALEKGASYVIIDNKDYVVDHRTILVKKQFDDIARTGSISSSVFKTTHNCTYREQWKNNNQRTNQCGSFQEVQHKSNRWKFKQSYWSSIDLAVF
jgi:UDP-N-acetylmuramyl tripeptide synthase